jgi:coenzyme F420-0:L-glutamate ligase
MQLYSYKLRLLTPPKDDLREAIYATKLTLKDGDIVAISSKVVSIGEGACVPMDQIEKKVLIEREADWHRSVRRFKHKHLFTIARGALVGASGIDESNGNGYYILYPEDPFKSARSLRAWLCKTYGVKKLAIIITDSKSDFLRRGATGFALAWDGIDPLRDYRGTEDLFGRKIVFEMANLIDSLAAAANLLMGETTERIPLVVIRDAPNISFKNRSSKTDQLYVNPEDDLFAPILFRPRWKKGGGGKR